MKLKIVDKAKYELLEKIAERTDNYISQIKTDIKKIDSLNNKIEELEDLVKNITILFQEKENQRRKNASKVGGLQTSLNKEKNKAKELLKYKVILENKIDENKNKMELKDLEIKAKDAEIQMLRGKGKKKNVEDYKNFVECRKELEKRSRSEE
ncbi:MAG: hypothetical protein MR598_03210 [Erysipelotrichaceae bacterium]|nr:hypothetical protein [Erysipelotrichaceae bacterium]